MKIAHLVLAHKNPKQLQMLLNALKHPEFDFYIHIDKKVNAEPFNYLINNKNIFFVEKRTKIYWAAWGTVQATINGFEEILPKKKYDYINVISAQDFPLKPAEYIYDYISGRNGTEFITCELLDTWKVEPRIKKYHLINWRIPGKYRLGDLLTSILPERKFPLPYIIAGRANWFTLTAKAAAYILEFLKSNPAVTRYFKYCWGADEFLFSTILFNSSFKNKIADNLLYVDWNLMDKGHPKILTESDYDMLKNSNKLFARKFDVDVDAEILKKLESNLSGLATKNIKALNE